MSIEVKVRTVFVLVGAVSVSAMLAGCVSPRYGTEKTANAHLMDGIGSMVSIAPPKKKSEVTYVPRPALVEPPEGAALPVPQQSVASADNPQWLESPEETRKRLIEEADSGNTRFNGSPLAKNPTSKEQFEKFRQARAQQKGAYEGRRYLSDPPPEYRLPAETAPADELGESEFQKEKRRKAAARKAKRGFRIWPF
ncbi:MAG: hypothetical protein NXI27_18925 [Alphaproteobacteria bacterium]|nr:hypothetical protein [Alphaproteobacteria bacterium]